ncbi:hypothetical protein Tco_0707817 [Tanacetum coccineum]
MQSPRTSHDRAIKQILRYLKGTTLLGIKHKRGNEMRVVGYSSHNVDIDDGRSTTGHVFYLGTSPITWCSQKQTTVALSSCEAEFMAATAAACQAIWLREVLTEVMKNEQVIIEHVSEENQRAGPLTKALACIRFKEMRSLLDGYLKANAKGLTVKSLSATRWESLVESVKAIRFQLSNIREALLQVSETDNDSLIKSTS